MIETQMDSQRWEICEGYGTGQMGLTIKDRWGSNPDVHLHDLSRSVQALTAERTNGEWQRSLMDGRVAVLESKVDELTKKLAELEKKVSATPVPVPVEVSALRAVHT